MQAPRGSLGFANLLRRVRASREVIVSTHDERLADLLARKLRPVAFGERTRVVRFDAWTRDGPIVEQYDVPMDARRRLSSLLPSERDR